ncbi:hypothetical protein L6452_33298 [Arctium lappa]|uniref:Uncharacterized protein n=1 Tax=Arctium lappa TaxID=4217 RepID=A0ACB8Z781_ARCLA|nr:hypothetical protein L6452_33298 [Arctium lappa]
MIHLDETLLNGRNKKSDDAKRIVENTETLVKKLTSNAPVVASTPISLLKLSAPHDVWCGVVLTSIAKGPETTDIVIIVDQHKELPVPSPSPVVPLPQLATPSGHYYYRSAPTSTKLHTTNTTIKGPWSSEEDKILTRFVQRYGPRKLLSPNVEHRPFSPDEDQTILAAHAQYGNRWATIAHRYAVKNHWNSTFKRRRFHEINTTDCGGGDFKMISLSCGSTNFPTSGTPANVGDEYDPMTALSLAPPGNGVMGGCELTVTGSRTEGLPAGFWDVMRDVIAREVREYVTTSFPETSPTTTSTSPPISSSFQVTHFRKCLHSSESYEDGELNPPTVAEAEDDTNTISFTTECYACTD